jgi:DNA-binding NarL/FixJ family response regulator
MDVRMPGMDGIEAAAHLIQAGSRARILMLTTFDLDQYVYRAMRVGASGFLLKDATRDQLATAVRTVAAGEALLAPSITRRLIEDFCRGPAPDAATAETTGQLTGREVDVVKLIAKGLSNAEIARQLYLSDATVKSHIARILAKLGLRDRVQVVVLAYETGIVRPGAPGKATSTAMSRDRDYARSGPRAISDTSVLQDWVICALPPSVQHAFSSARIRRPVVRASRVSHFPAGRGVSLLTGLRS